MAPTRLSDDQKQEIVARYREGASSTELAGAFGCSANTVSRVVKAALAPDDYERLKQQRGRSTRSGSGNAQASEPAEASAPPARPQPSAAPATHQEEDEDGDGDRDGDGPGVLAIDDADDFADDSDDDDSDDEDGSDDGSEADVFMTVPVQLEARVQVECLALSEAQLPASAYLLVDRTVELQPTPLGDCPDLGPLPEREAERQALTLFVNPRQAKRHCGRSQRVIKLPDLRLLERTAPYLLAQGISRVVIEGGIYSLPGS